MLLLMIRHNESPEWAHTLAARVGLRVKKYRTQVGLSAQMLADRTAALGHEVKRSVIAEMENGKRTTAPLADVLVLARGLGVPPILLIYPLDETASVEVLPNEDVPAWDAYDWTVGEQMLRSAAPWVSDIPDDRREVARWKETTNPLALRREYVRTRSNFNGHSIWADIYEQQAQQATGGKAERLHELAVRETELATRSDKASKDIARELEQLGAPLPHTDHEAE